MGLGDPVAPRLARFLAERLGRPVRVLELERSTEGFSQETFACEIECRYLLTRLRQEVAPGQWYHGAGVFRYDPSGQSMGEWFGIFGDRNLGLGRRDGERWVWDIHRAGRGRVLRVRERVGPDEYRMTNTSVDADGRTRVTREVMRRVKAGAVADGGSDGGPSGASWVMPAEYRAVQRASLESQRRFLHAMTDSMPEAYYGDVDNPGQRTFAEHVYHAAVANAQAVDRLFAGPVFVAPDPAAAVRSRAALDAAIDAAFDFLEAALAAQSETDRQRTLRFAGGSIPAWQVWDELNEHTYWTLGEIVGNFRSKGMAPPAFRFF